MKQCFDATTWHGRLEFPELYVLRRQQTRKFRRQFHISNKTKKTQIGWHRGTRPGAGYEGNNKQEATVFGITACVSHPAKLVAQSPAKGGGSFLAGDSYASRAADDRTARPDQNCDDGPQGGGAINLVARWCSGWFISSHLITSRRHSASTDF